MFMTGIQRGSADSSLLFFLLDYLLLFYDSRPIARAGRDVLGRERIPCGDDSTPLFFILVFLLLFYR